MRIFAPTSLALVALGFVLLPKGGWATVLSAVCARDLSIVVPGRYRFFGPESRRIGKAIDQQGSDAQEGRFRIERILCSRALRDQPSTGRTVFTPQDAIRSGAGSSPKEFRLRPCLHACSELPNYYAMERHLTELRARMNTRERLERPHS